MRENLVFLKNLVTSTRLIFKKLVPLVRLVLITSVTISLTLHKIGLLLMKNRVRQIPIHMQHKCLLGIKCKGKLTGGEKHRTKILLWKILLTSKSFRKSFLFFYKVFFEEIVFIFSSHFKSPISKFPTKRCMEKMFPLVKQIE